MFDPFNSLPPQWFELDSPFLYWFVTYVFGPAFTMGIWGILLMVLAHLIPFVLILRRKWQSLKTTPLLKRTLALLGLLLVIHLSVGLLFWLLLPLFMTFFYRP